MAESLHASNVNQEPGPCSTRTTVGDSGEKASVDLGPEKMPEGVSVADQTEKCVNISTPKSLKRKAVKSLDEDTSDFISRKAMTLNSPADTAREIEKVKSRIASKQEKLRKLKLARTYRTKWEMQDLNSLTDVWLTGCRSALLDLRTRLEEKGGSQDGSEQLTLDTLIQHFGIDKNLIGLDTAEDCFV